MYRKLLVLLALGALVLVRPVGAENIIEYTSPTMSVPEAAGCASSPQPIPTGTFITTHFRLSQGNAQVSRWEASVLTRAGAKGWVLVDPALPSGFYTLHAWSSVHGRQVSPTYCRAMRFVNSTFVPAQTLFPADFKPLAPGIEIISNYSR